MRRLTTRLDNGRHRIISTLAGMFLFISGAAHAADAPPGPASPNGAEVLEWNARAAQLIVGPGGAGKAPVLGLIDLAIVHTAIYDAVNAVEGFPFRTYAVVADVPGPASAGAAAAAAGKGTLISLYPGRSADIEAWYAASLNAIPDGAEKQNGILVGEQTAAGILALRANDGRNDGTPIVEPPAAPGVWIRTPPAFAAPLAPWVRFVTPWNLVRPSQFRPGPPPRLNSRKYLRDYQETLDFGGAVGGHASAEQKDVGRFWGDQPMLQWNRAWRQIAVAQELSNMDSARFFALLATATSDALIACWDAKFEYMSWRPVTAIRAAPDRPRDPAWSSLVTTPNHPEYPGAHGCLSAAATGAMERYFTTDSFAFTIDSAFAGVTTPVRSYTSFSQALEEVIDARVWGGMHYRSSSETGARLGSKAAKLAARAFRRAHAEGHNEEDEDRASESDLDASDAEDGGVSSSPVEGAEDALPSVDLGQADGAVGRGGHAVPGSQRVHGAYAQAVAQAAALSQR